MHQVLSSGLWSRIEKTAKKAKIRQCAIAYVTRELIQFSAGDVLITNASRQSIANGETDAKLLRRLSKRGVRVFNCENLHSKIMLFDNVAVIGSANMSTSSERSLIETSLLTDHASIASGVASTIEQLKTQAEELGPARLNELCKIPVVRRGGGHGRAEKDRTHPRIASLGNRTWIVGVQERSQDLGVEEQALVNKAMAELSRSEGGSDDPDWVRWTPSQKFGKEARAGDLMVQVWRSAKASRPSHVYLPVPILLKQQTKKWTRVYCRDDVASISWGRFRQLLRELGYTREVRPTSQILLEPDFANTLAIAFHKAARQNRRKSKS